MPSFCFWCLDVFGMLSTLATIHVYIALLVVSCSFYVLTTCESGSCILVLEVSWSVGKAEAK